MPRSHDQVVWDFVESWLDKAGSDLRATEVLLPAEQIDPSTVAFHAQQAAEKYLKSLLVRHQVPFPRTHDIGKLLELAETVEPGIEAELATAAALTPYAVEFRYPGEQLEREDARNAVDLAREVRETVLHRLRGYLDAGRPA